MTESWQKIKKTSRIWQKIFTSLFVTLLIFSGTIQCKKDKEKKSVQKDEITKLVYSISSLLYFAEQVQNFFEEILSWNYECVKKETESKSVFYCDNTTPSVNGFIEKTEQNSYEFQLKVTSPISAISAEIKGKVSAETGMNLKDVNLFIQKKENGTAYQGYIYFSGLTYYKFRRGFKVDSNTGGIKVEWIDKINMEFRDFEARFFQNSATQWVVEIKGVVKSSGECVGDGEFNTNINVQSFLLSGGGETIVIPICPTKIEGDINSEKINFELPCESSRTGCIFP